MYLLSYLIFDFVCLTLSSADTHGIEKYARTYIRDAHTHAHTHTKKKKGVERLEKKVGNPQKSRGGIRKERKKKKKKRTKRKGRKRRRKMRGKGEEEKKKKEGGEWA
jgi:Skp family chaperone for outer membrane proteins